MIYALPKWPLSKISTDKGCVNFAVHPPDATYFDLDEVERSSLQRWKEKWYRLWGFQQITQSQSKLLPESLRGIGPGAQECLLVMCGERDTARIIVPVRMVAAAIRLANTLGLAAIPSPFLIRTIRLDPDQTYSDSVELVPDGVSEPRAKAFVYLAQNADMALRAWVSELLQDDAKMGRLFGYPQCCIASFKRHSKIQPVSDIDNIVEYTPRLTNQYSRLFGFELISHKPCAPDCSETLLLAKRYLQTLESISPTTSVYLMGFLSSPVLVIDSVNFIMLIDSTQVGKHSLEALTSRLLSFGAAAHDLRQRLAEADTVITFQATDLGIMLETDVFSKLLPHARLVFHTVEG